MTGFLTRQARRLAALIVLAGLLVGAPWALWRLGSPLLPDHVPSGSQIWAGLTERDSGQLFLGALVVIGFAAWACFAVCLLADVTARITHRQPIRLPGLRAPQAAVGALVGLLIAGTLAINTAPAALADTLPALPHPVPAATAVVTTATSTSATPPLGRALLVTRPPQVARRLPGRGHPGARTSGPIWTVAKGDTLWSIAEHTLGDGTRWPDIAALNEGRPQADGATLVSADWLHIGWKIELPADAHLPNTAARDDATTVTVNPGDTLSEIAQQTLGDGNLYPELAATNHIDDPNLIYPGQVIEIPAPARHHQSPETKPASRKPEADANHPGSPHAVLPPSAPTNPPSPTPASAHQAVPHAADAPSAHQPAHHYPAPTNETMPKDPAGSADSNSTPGDTATATPTPGTARTPIPGAAESNGSARPGAPSAGDGPARIAASASASDGDHAPWVLGGITGLLAAMAWAGLLLARRRGEQARRPGQRPAAPTLDSASTERALRQHACAADPQRINAAMRSITTTVAERMPAGFHLVTIGTDSMDLRPATPAPPPTPFTGDEHTWTLPLPTAGTDPGEDLAALPALITLGVTDAGTTIAVDAEHLGAMQITGDPQRCRQLANHLILELAQSPWCDGMHLHLPSRDRTFHALDEYRLASTKSPEGAVQFLAKHVTRIRDLLDGQTIAAARATSNIPDAWEPHTLIARSDALAEVAAIDDLIDRLQTGPPAAAALIAVGDDLGIHTRIVIDADGTLHLPETLGGGTIQAAGITDEELDAVTGLFETAGQVCDPQAGDAQASPDGGVADDAGTVEGDPGTTPPDADAPATATVAAPDDLNGHADLDGIRLRGVAVGADAPLVDTRRINGRQRPLEPADGSHLQPARPTPPAGPDGRRRQRPHQSADDVADAALDGDLAEWHGTTGCRLKIAILGPARVVGFGPRRDGQPSRITEFAVYLALHPSGVSTDKFVTDLWPDERQPTAAVRRAAVSHLRVALGDHPDTHEQFVPPAAGGYRLIDRLVDAELFGRLAARADRETRLGDPTQALADLRSALALVRGPVLAEVVGPGYSWLANPDRMEDRVLPMRIIDAAHSATELALQVGDLPAAEAAAKTARLVDPYSNIPLCDLIRIAIRAGDQQTAHIWAKLILQSNEVDLPQDLPEPARTVVTDLYRAQLRLAGTKAHR